MGLRFRKNLRLLPGVRINLSKSGASLSLGGKGATVNIGRKGVRKTIGLPGSGLSHSSYEKYEGSNKALMLVWIVVLAGGAYLAYYLRSN